jgi:hypothetical protein
LGIEVTPSYIAPSNSATITKISATTTAAMIQSGITSSVINNTLNRHVVPQVPDWTASDVINVKKALTLPKATIRQTTRAAIQAAINASSNAKVFLPRGEYMVKNTLTLNSSTVLFGLHKNISRLQADEVGSAAFKNNPTPQPLVRSADSPGGWAKLADLMLSIRMTAGSCYFLDWKTGGNSVVQNVNFDRRVVDKTQFGVTGLAESSTSRWSASKATAVVVGSISSTSPMATSLIHRIFVSKCADRRDDPTPAVLHVQSRDG